MSVVFCKRLGIIHQASLSFKYKGGRKIRLKIRQEVNMDRKTVQNITLGFGIFYALIGVLGFIPGITVASAEHGGMPGEGLLLGIFGVDYLHDVSHILFGAILIYG